MGGEAFLSPFREGEYVEIHRTLPNGRRTIMFVLAHAASSLERHRMQLSAQVVSFGETPFADGRVARQYESIQHLLRHLEQHCSNSSCPHRFQPAAEGDVYPITYLAEGIISNTPAPEEGTIINWNGMNFIPQREGASNDNSEEDPTDPS